MRWSKQVREGLSLIYSLATVELEAGQWSAIECVAGEEEDDRPCNKCEECKARQEMEKGVSYLSYLIDKHDRAKR